MKDFYQIVASEGANYRLQFNAEHPIYKAHFPDNPITPAVCFVQIAQDIVSMYLHKNCLISSVPFYKLVVAHNPKQIVDVMLQLQENNKARLVFKVAENQLSSLTIEYIFADPL